jgi:hypothetical protein
MYKRAPVTTGWRFFFILKLIEMGRNPEISGEKTIVHNLFITSNLAKFLIDIFASAKHPILKYQCCNTRLFR